MKSWELGKVWCELNTSTDRSNLFICVVVPIVDTACKFVYYAAKISYYAYKTNLLSQIVKYVIRI